MPVVPVPAPAAEGATLILLSDLSVNLPSSFFLDFDVFNFVLCPKNKQLCILIDNGEDDGFQFYGVTHCKISDLSSGYHLVRAWLWQDGQVLKQDSAYIEAEFFVESPAPQSVRPFMFGQPSLCCIVPSALSKQTLEEGFPVDFFVHNCELGDRSFSIRVYLNDRKVGTIRENCLHKITNFVDTLKRSGSDATAPSVTTRSKTTPPKVTDPVRVSIRLVLITPSGEELVHPQYNYEQRSVELEEPLRKKPAVKEEEMEVEESATASEGPVKAEEEKEEKSP